MKNLEPFFNPKSLLIIGVSRREFTFNSTILKNLLEIFYRRNIYIVNPNAEEILGVKCYHTLEELPEIPELAIIVLGKNIVEIFRELCKFGIKNVAIESDLNAGIYDYSVKAELNRLSEENGIVYMGPAMIGIINYINNYTSSIIPVRNFIMKRNKNVKAGVSFLGQSGGLAGALGWWAPSQNLPISKVIHLGEGYNINEADVLNYFIEDKTTEVITLFLREISDEIINVVEKLAPMKPVLFFYVGKEEFKEKLLEKAGGIPVLNYIELFEFAKIFLWCPEPKGSNLGIIGPSSGAIYIIVKEMRKQNLSLAKVTSESRQKILDKVGGSTCNLGNPVDYWPPEKFIGTEICEIFNTSSNTLLKDESVDGLILALEFFIEIEFDFSIFKKIRETYPNKPIITILIQAEREGTKRVIKAASKLKIPVFDNEIERAVRGYKLLYDYYSKIKRN